MKKIVINSEILNHIVKLTTEVVDVDPELAAIWLASNPNNREVNNAKVNDYCERMKRGEWMIGDALMFDWNGRLVNGQHRLRAIIKYGKSIQFAVTRGYDPEVVNILDDNKRRNTTDVYTMMEYKYFNKPSKSELKLIATSIKYMNNMLDNKKNIDIWNNYSNRLMKKILTENEKFYIEPISKIREWYKQIKISIGSTNVPEGFIGGYYYYLLQLKNKKKFVDNFMECVFNNQGNYTLTKQFCINVRNVKYLSVDDVKKDLDALFELFKTNSLKQTTKLSWSFKR